MQIRGARGPILSGGPTGWQASGVATTIQTEKHIRLGHGPNATYMTAHLGLWVPLLHACAICVGYPLTPLTSFNYFKLHLAVV